MSNLLLIQQKNIILPIKYIFTLTVKKQPPKRKWNYINLQIKWNNLLQTQKFAHIM